MRLEIDIHSLCEKVPQKDDLIFHLFTLRLSRQATVGGNIWHSTYALIIVVYELYNDITPMEGSL